MKTETITWIIISLNQLIAGIHWGRMIEDGFIFDSKLEKFWNIAFALSSHVLGVIFLIIILLFHLLQWLNGIFQITFLFNFYFSKRWKNMTQNELRRANQICLSAPKYKKSWFFRKALDMINKRHDYKYQESASEDPEPRLRGFAQRLQEIEKSKKNNK